MDFEKKEKVLHPVERISAEEVRKWKSETDKFMRNILNALADTRMRLAKLESHLFHTKRDE